MTSARIKVGKLDTSLGEVVVSSDLYKGISLQ